MTHNDDLQRTPHPERGGGSIASPGVKGERERVGNGNTYLGVPLRGGGGGARTPPERTLCRRVKHVPQTHGRYRAACQWPTALINNMTPSLYPENHNARVLYVMQMLYHQEEAYHQRIARVLLVILANRTLVYHVPRVNIKLILEQTRV